VLFAFKNAQFGAFRTAAIRISSSNGIFESTEKARLTSSQKIEKTQRFGVFCWSCYIILIFFFFNQKKGSQVSSVVNNLSNYQEGEMCVSFFLR
jgi:hypothetical protein